MWKFLKGLAAFVLCLVMAGIILGSFWLGLLPQSWSPFSPLSLDERPQWFLDARLAALRRDPDVCQAVLKAPYIATTPIPDAVKKKDCGWQNAVKVSGADGVRFAVEPLTCEMAVATALWITYELQPAAEEILGTKVTAINDFGTYDCRKMIGNPLWKNRMSEHASANALDIAGFTLADGRSISVLRNWKGSSPEARFLHEVHQRACRYFRVTLSPNFNAAHRDHFHFDRGNLWTCR